MRTRPPLRLSAVFHRRLTVPTSRWCLCRRPVTLGTRGPQAGQRRRSLVHRVGRSCCIVTWQKTLSQPMLGCEMDIDDLRSGFANPPASAAPMMRWWWFGPSVTRPELERELTAMVDAGLGGVEVAYVYPLATATTECGSPTFLAD